jgi:hypothetical protein
MRTSWVSTVTAWTPASTANERAERATYTAIIVTTFGTSAPIPALVDHVPEKLSHSGSRSGLAKGVLTTKRGDKRPDQSEPLCSGNPANLAPEYVGRATRGELGPAERTFNGLRDKRYGLGRTWRETPGYDLHHAISYGETARDDIPGSGRQAEPPGRGATE